MKMKKRGLYIFLSVLALLAAAALLFHPKPGPHSVTLTWRAAAVRSGASIAGYNVYRRTAETSSFVKIADKYPASPYEDRLVNSGRSYVYVVTSVLSTGQESRYSTEANAQVP
jgi:fibronectin type 3 domain-containing protein